MTSEVPSAIRSVDRALEVLSQFTFEHQTRSLRELCEATRLPRTTVLRLLDALGASSMITDLGGSEYAVGPGLLRWSSLATAHFALPAAARAALAALVEVTGETASIYVRAGVRRICVAQHESSQALRHVAVIGRERPLWVGAAGRILLSGLGDAELNAVAKDVPAAEATREQLATWRAATAESGFAATHNERQDGLSVIAVPLRTLSRETVAALSIAGPATRISPDRIPGLLAQLGAAQDQIEHTAFPNSLRIGR